MGFTCRNIPCFFFCRRTFGKRQVNLDCLGSQLQARTIYSLISYVFGQQPAGVWKYNYFLNLVVKTMPSSAMFSDHSGVGWHRIGLPWSCHCDGGDITGVSGCSAQLWRTFQPLCQSACAPWQPETEREVPPEGRKLNFAYTPTNGDLLSYLSLSLFLFSPSHFPLNHLLPGICFP